MEGRALTKCGKLVHGYNRQNKQNEYNERDEQSDELGNASLRVIVYPLIRSFLAKFFCWKYLLHVQFDQPVILE
jgi:hypothetical protein